MVVKEFKEGLGDYLATGLALGAIGGRIRFSWRWSFPVLAIVFGAGGW